MKARFLFTRVLIVWGVFSSFMAVAQPSPKQFLGYSLGEEFTYHHRMVDYFWEVAAKSDKVKVVEYGTTSERRPLVAAFISSAENIARLEEIRKANLGATGMMTEGFDQEMQKPIVWLSYNIHGNEAVSMEAAMKVLYDLASGSVPDVEKWLQEVVVVIDPCENPDGRDRYANWYNQVKHQFRDINSDTREHREPWPGGRFNHYLFDLNRDWAWQTQKETRHRIAIYQQYMPHIHVDLHEMGFNSPYFFSPSAEPFHKSITDWQREFHDLSGVNHAKYFDKEGWLYFTKETFDMFYPSYGDTWPTFNGAMGFTFEQGGSGRAGLGVKMETGDTLTLSDRIAHHYATSISTIELGYTYRDRLLNQFNEYFQEGSNNPEGKYRSYIIKTESSSPNRIKALTDLLDKQKIRYGYAKSGRNMSGFSYQQNKEAPFSVSNKDIVVSAYQPQHHLVKVLFEPNPLLVDSMTYDLTAWAIPYIYGVEAYATEARVEPGKAVAWPKVESKAPKKPAYAYAIRWDDFTAAQFLSKAFQQGLRVRYTEQPIQVKGEKFKEGTLLVLKGDNRYVQGFGDKVRAIASEFHIKAYPIASGLVDAGKDFGSSSVKMIKKPKVAIVSGEGVSATSYGEIWHYFEQQLKYPVSSINGEDLSRSDLSAFNVLVLPSGSYQAYKNTIMDFARQGGKVIAYDRAVRLFEDNNTALKRGLDSDPSSGKSGKEDLLKTYGDRQRERISNGVEGSIFKVDLDTTHPLAFGLPNPFYLVKRNSRVYPYLPAGGWNVGVYKEDSHIAGFVGAKLKPKLMNSLAFGAERMGRGSIVYFPDSPTFRGFWHSGMILMGNAVFFE